MLFLLFLLFGFWFLFFGFLVSHRIHSFLEERGRGRIIERGERGEESENVTSSLIVRALFFNGIFGLLLFFPYFFSVFFFFFEEGGGDGGEGSRQHFPFLWLLFCCPSLCSVFFLEDRFSARSVRRYDLAVLTNIGAIQSICLLLSVNARLQGASKRADAPFFPALCWN